MILLDNVNSDTVSEDFESKGGSSIFILRGDDFTGVTVNVIITSANDSLERGEIIESFDAATTKKVDYLATGVLFRVETDGVGSGDNIFAEII